MEQNQDTFEQFGLSEALMNAISAVGYEVPTPIQVKTIPHLLAGKDVIGQAQTGTGKTAAFALPILEKIDLQRKEVQALILTPTRELGIQVAEAFLAYGKPIGDIRVLPVYGGQFIQTQINRLKSGVHVVVGTPGRIMDHLRRGTLTFDSLKMVVLDEADEMLRMGFIEDVEWILAQAPETLQTALFSATMPKEIRQIADKYLHDPVSIETEQRTLTVPNIEQRYLVVTESQKVDALANVLETQMPDGAAALIFARTKLGAAELTDKLKARGCAAEAMHGDMSQVMRENVVRRLRSGDLEVVVATDVAARGWDVERIGMVINYDVPYDTEAYVHRIGRTGRAGRAGKALMFITPRQKRLLHDIERYTGQRIEPIKMPTQADIANRRIALFKERILNTLEEQELDLYIDLVQELSAESGRTPLELAAAAARMARGDRPLEVVVEPVPDEKVRTAEGRVRLFIDAGRSSGVRPGDIVGAIANEAGLPGNLIGPIDIFERFSLVGVPEEHLQHVLETMSGSTIRSQNARMRVATPGETQPPQRSGKGPRSAFSPRGTTPSSRHSPAPRSSAPAPRSSAPAAETRQSAPSRPAATERGSFPRSADTQRSKDRTNPKDKTGYPKSPKGRKKIKKK
jgi:ATP-dependent RNA helicase DeaD